MKIKRFNTETVVATPSGKPVIYVHSGGNLSLNKFAAARMKLKPGHKIEVVQDEERTKDWYLLITLSGPGFELRFNSKERAEFNSCYTAKELLKSLVTPPPGCAKYSLTGSRHLTGKA